MFITTEFGTAIRLLGKIMNNEEIIKQNAILIIEQKNEIERLRTLIRNIAKELPLEYDDSDEEEYLPQLAAYWVGIARTVKENANKISYELQELGRKLKC